MPENSNTRDTVSNGMDKVAIANEGVVLSVDKDDVSIGKDEKRRKCDDAMMEGFKNVVLVTRTALVSCSRCCCYKCRLRYKVSCLGRCLFFVFSNGASNLAACTWQSFLEKVLRCRQ